MGGSLASSLFASSLLLLLTFEWSISCIRLQRPPAESYAVLQALSGENPAEAANSDDSNSTVLDKPTLERTRILPGTPGPTSPFVTRAAAALAADASQQESPAPTLVAPASTTVAIDTARSMSANSTPTVDGRQRVVEPAHRVLDILSSLSGSPIKQGGKSTCNGVCDTSTRTWW